MPNSGGERNRGALTSSLFTTRLHQNLSTTFFLSANMAEMHLCGKAILTSRISSLWAGVGSTWSHYVHIQITNGLKFNPGNKNQALVYQLVKGHHVTGCSHCKACRASSSQPSIFSLSAKKSKSTLFLLSPNLSCQSVLWWQFLFLLHSFLISNHCASFVQLFSTVASADTVNQLLL